jgi:dTDP-4-dehydrorhamnose reductase
MKKKILIFGGDGQLGYDLKRVLEPDFRVVSLNRQALDITDGDSVEKLITKEKPAFVINAAAYNKVDEAERDIQQAFEVNAFAVFFMAKASERAGAVFIHFSTDYVFGGDKEFFKEDDLPKPLNIYGESKLSGERLVEVAAEKYFIIRTSSVFGVKQSGQKANFVDKIISLAKEGKPLKVADDQIMSPTYSLDLAAKVGEVIKNPPAFGIYHVTNSGSCSWYGFAVEILRLMDIKIPLTAVKTEELVGKAKRPKTSVLKTSALIGDMPSWQDGLKRYLKEKYQKN